MNFLIFEINGNRFNISCNFCHRYVSVYDFVVEQCKSLFCVSISEVCCMIVRAGQEAL